MNRVFKKVKMYSTPTCVYCVTLKKFLEERGIPYEEVDVAASESAAKEMVKKSGQMGVPVVEIEGQIIIGFDRDKISEILGL